MNQITEYQLEPAAQDDRKAVNSLVHTSGLQIEEQLSRDYDFLGYLITNEVSDKILGQTYEALQASLIPATDNEIAKGLLKLRALTSHKVDGQDIDLILEAYVEQLRDYPREAVLESLNRMAGHVKWFPSWHELKDDIEFRCKHRIGLMKAIERKMDVRRISKLRQISG